MACIKQTYVAVATWTQLRLSELFRDAFIDAGLMTSWHDSFLSGSVENRVLRVVHAAGKAYGTTFYWFSFASYGVFLQVTTGWDTTTHQPTGTLYLDFITNVTNSPSDHWGLLTNIATSDTVELVRYTSGADSRQSWFVMRCGSQRRAFTITAATLSLQPWLRLDLGCYCGFSHVSLETSYGLGRVRFRSGPKVRRELTMGCGLVGQTTLSNYTDLGASQNLLGYAAVGYAANNTNNYNISSPFIFLPVGFSATNPAYAANSSPVFYSMPYSPYVVDPLPVDFGLCFHYATNSFSVGDTFVVSSGTEEWEVLDYAANSSSLTGASPLFLARLI